eukprot:1143875-Pelagomonas_calceolata.AAC.9
MLRSLPGLWLDSFAYLASVPGVVTRALCCYSNTALVVTCCFSNKCCARDQKWLDSFLYLLPPSRVGAFPPTSSAGLGVAPKIQPQRGEHRNSSSQVRRIVNGRKWPLCGSQKPVPWRWTKKHNQTVAFKLLRGSPKVAPADCKRLALLGSESCMLPVDAAASGCQISKAMKHNVMGVGVSLNKNNPQGLEGVERRWVQFGGGAASPEQVAWFKQQLQCLISNT